MQATFILTVSESKRLIARAVAQHPRVRAALESGLVVIGRGTTNAYVAEELLGHNIDKTAYVAGRTVPDKDETVALKFAARPIPEVVLRDGRPDMLSTLAEAVQQMGSRDVFIKGANALDPSRRLAGVLVEHETGGTLGTALGTVIARKVGFIIPVGLEKLVTGDLDEAAAQTLVTNPEGVWTFPSLWLVRGMIITEIEALKILTGATARHIGSGGVAGAEGSVRLLVEGGFKEVQAALDLAGRIHGEPPFTR
jgi:hypothetical protein